MYTYIKYFELLSSARNNRNKANDVVYRRTLVFRDREFINANIIRTRCILKLRARTVLGVVSDENIILRRNYFTA